MAASTVIVLINSHNPQTIISDYLFNRSANVPLVVIQYVDGLAYV